MEKARPPNDGVRDLGTDNIWSGKRFVFSQNLKMQFVPGCLVCWSQTLMCYDAWMYSTYILYPFVCKGKMVANALVTETTTVILSPETQGKPVACVGSLNMKVSQYAVITLTTNTVWINNSCAVTEHQYKGHANIPGTYWWTGYASSINLAGLKSVITHHLKARVLDLKVYCREIYQLSNIALEICAVAALTCLTKN
jgi:hypothetical protein